jgi:hypothetical protein
VTPRLKTAAVFPLGVEHGGQHHRENGRGDDEFTMVRPQRDLAWRIGGPQGSGVDAAAGLFARACAIGGLDVFGRREYYSNIGRTGGGDHGRRGRPDRSAQRDRHVGAGFLADG